MPTSGVERVYLARHGRTALNADGRLRGLSDPPLDDVGQVEAKRLGEALAALSPTLVITSPLQRAIATAEAIGSAAHVRVEIDQRLNDRDYGPWTGEPRIQVEKRFGTIDAAPGVEPADAVAARALAAFTDIANEYHDGPLVMVSHDAFNTALLRMLDPELDGITQRTACYNQISRGRTGWRVDFYDRKPQ